MTAYRDDPIVPPGTRFVFRPWRRCPHTGRIMWAKAYGLRAWRIPVEE